MIQKPDIIIAIDPDTDKSGVAELHSRTGCKKVKKENNASKHVHETCNVSAN